MPPHFELMDEQSAVEYLLRCQHDMIAAAKNEPTSKIAASFALLALHLDQTAMSDLMAKIMAKRSLLRVLTRLLRQDGIPFRTTPTSSEDVGSVVFELGAGPFPIVTVGPKELKLPG